MSEPRHGGRHTAPPNGAAPRLSGGVDTDEVWVPPPYEPVRPGDFVEYSIGGWEVKKSHRGRNLFLAIVLVAALGGGGWWWYQRSHDDSQIDAVQACQKENAGAIAASASFVHVSAGGRIPAGVPLPTEAVWVQCRATSGTGASGESAVWRTTSQSDYEGLLVAAGWIPSRRSDAFTVWISGTDRHVILTGTIEHHLVAFFRN